MLEGTLGPLAQCGCTVKGSQSDIEFNEGGGLVQWLKLHMWKVGDRGFIPRSGIQVSPRTRKESVLWETL